MSISSGSGGCCTATLSAGSQGSNWCNLNVSLTGSSTWTVTMNLVSPAVVYPTWNVSAAYPSQYVLKAAPNGKGNNRGVTISPNPTANGHGPRSPAVQGVPVSLAELAMAGC